MFATRIDNILSTRTERETGDKLQKSRKVYIANKDTVTEKGKKG